MEKITREGDLRRVHKEINTNFTIVLVRNGYKTTVYFVKTKGKQRIIFISIIV